MITAGVVCRELIGRASEFAFLLARVRSAEAHASALVVVRGEAGIGKSRLIDDVTRLVGAEGHRIVHGAAREYANAPYAALEEALEHLGIDASRSVDGPQGDAKTRRFAAIGEALVAAGEANGCSVVVVVEDLHWADLGTLELLRFLAGRLARSRVLFLTTHRHDEVEADSARARALATLEREADAVVTLDPLGGEQIDELLTSVIRESGRSVPADALPRIRELAEGRPLFAEELLRGVLERLDRHGHESPAVPTSIRATVRERYGTLPEGDRSILLHAAVVGRRFSARFVAALAERDELDVYAALRRARDRQLVVEEPDDEGDAFAFRHALTREAVYGELLRAEARLMHGKVARALAGATTPDVASIAEHAWRAGGSEAGPWNERAGDEAFAVYAYADATRAYERAFNTLSEGTRRGYLAERAAEAWYALGDLTHCVEWLGRAADARRAAGEHAAAWRLSLRKARVLFEWGRYDEGLAEANRVIAASEVDVTMRFEGEMMVAGLLTSRDRAAEALERLRRAEQLDARPEPTVLTRFAGAYGFTLSKLGQAQAARERFETAVEIARRIGDADALLRASNNWGNLELAHGTLTRARQLYGQALQVASETKNQHFAAWIGQNAALVTLLAGDLAEARALLNGVARIDHGVNKVHRFVLALSLRLATLDGRAEDALLERAVAALDEAIDHVDLEAITMLAAAIAYRRGADGDAETAARVIARVLPIYESAEAPYWLIDVAMRYGLPPARGQAHDLIDGLARREGSLPARGMLALADAREALRRRQREESVRHAEAAVAAFAGAGWAIDEGYALELAGRGAEAVALFGRIGAHGEVRRLTQTSSATARRRGEATLTAREREIATMLLDERATRAIAEALVISERTVETHIASVYRKLGVANRRELAVLLRTSAPAT